MDNNHWSSWLWYHYQSWHQELPSILVLFKFLDFILSNWSTRSGCLKTILESLLLLVFLITKFRSIECRKHFWLVRLSEFAGSSSLRRASLRRETGQDPRTLVQEGWLFWRCRFGECSGHTCHQALTPMWASSRAGIYRKTESGKR